MTKFSKIILGALLFFGSVAAIDQVQAKPLSATQMTKLTNRSILKAGDYAWNDTVDQTGRITITVNLTTQMAYVQRGHTLIGITNISSGRDGFETPVGQFKILGKEDNHFSKKYKADMPWTMWVNNEGVALHSGGTPGRTSSHGCVHLPTEFAHQLYDVINVGVSVTITNDPVGDSLDIDVSI